MAFFDRTTSFPPISEIVQVPQIVIVDLTGPNITFGTAPGAACVIGEFVAGSFVPTEVVSPADITSQYTGNAKVYPYLSQDAGGIQNGGQASFNGNGYIQLISKTFRRLIIQRVDHEAVTTDGGTTKAALQVTVTVAAADQDGLGNTIRDIVIPGGTRFGDNANFGSATKVFAASGNFTIPKGSALTSNAITVSIPCFPVKVVEPVVSTAANSLTSVIDPVLPNVAATTAITAITNASALWPSGVGTTLSARVESQYSAAIGKTLPNNTPMSAIVITWAARRSPIIRPILAQNAIDSSNSGRARIACVAAEPAAGTSSSAASAAKTAALGLAASDNYVQPADRVIICFPLAKLIVQDLGNIKVTINSDGWMAVTLNNFPEEYNPGSRNPYIQAITELEDAFVANPLVKQDYANFIQAGVCALYRDNTVGWQFQQGVTAANPASFPTRAPIKRRRMADLVQDTLAQLAAPYNKLPATTDRRDSFNSEIITFLDGLLSPQLPAAQRINGYLVDEKGGNTPDLNKLGVFVTNVYVQLLPTMDYIVFVTQIGETVTIPVSTPAAA